MLHKLAPYFQHLLPGIAIIFLLGSCDTPSGSGSGGVTDGGYKDVQLIVNADHDLDKTAAFPDETVTNEKGQSWTERCLIDFPARAISSTTTNGVTTFTVRLEPYTDNAEWMPPNATKYRVSPIQPDIRIRSRKLSGIPLEKIKFCIGIASAGPQKGQACYLEIPARILRLQPKGSSLATVVSEDTSNGQYSIPQVAIDPERYRASKENIKNWEEMTYVEGYNEGQKWDPATSSWLGAPHLYLGDAGGSLYLQTGGWKLEGHPAGPGGSDMSYLEPKSTRGKFD